MADRTTGYEDLNDEMKGKLMEELAEDLVRMEKARTNLVQLMEGIEDHKVAGMDSHNFMVETLRTQLEVSLDNLNNAIYQTQEILKEVEG